MVTGCSCDLDLQNSWQRSRQLDRKCLAFGWRLGFSRMARCWLCPLRWPACPQAHLNRRMGGGTTSALPRSILPPHLPLSRPPVLVLRTPLCFFFQIAPDAGDGDKKPPSFSGPSTFWLENPLLQPTSSAPFTFRGLEETRARLLRPLATPAPQLASLDKQSHFLLDLPENLGRPVSGSVPSPGPSAQNENLEPRQLGVRLELGRGRMEAVTAGRSVVRASKGWMSSEASTPVVLRVGEGWRSGRQVQQEGNWALDLARNKFLIVLGHRRVQIVSSSFPMSVFTAGIVGGSSSSHWWLVDAASGSQTTP